MNLQKYKSQIKMCVLKAYRLEVANELSFCLFEWS